MAEADFLRNIECISGKYSGKRPFKALSSRCEYRFLERSIPNADLRQVFFDEER